MIGRKQPKTAPFSWLQRRTPEPKQVSLRCQLARVGGLAGAHVLDGLEGYGDVTADTMELVADDVQSVIIPGSGHYCLEEAPTRY